MGGPRMKITLASAALALAVASPAMAQESIRFFNIFDANAARLWEEPLANYTAETGVRIESESVAGSGAAVYPDVLRTSIASGDPADVFFMWGGSLAQPFIDAGQVREI